LIETASATGSAGAGFAAERDLYNVLSADKTDSLETDVNPGSEAVVTGCMAGASVAAGAGAWVVTGAAPPQAEINKPKSKITKKDFRDIKESFYETIRPPEDFAGARSNFLENISQRIKNPPHLRRIYFLLFTSHGTYLAFLGASRFLP
jgi:hypothetical protein